MTARIDPSIYPEGWDFVADTRRLVRCKIVRKGKVNIQVFHWSFLRSYLVTAGAGWERSSL